MIIIYIYLMNYQWTYLVYLWIRLIKKTQYLKYPFDKELLINIYIYNIKNYNNDLDEYNINTNYKLKKN